MLSPALESDDEFLTRSGPFSIRQKLTIISEHAKIKSPTKTPTSFLLFLERAVEKHKKPNRFLKIDVKSKNIGKASSAGISSIFGTPNRPKTDHDKENAKEKPKRLLKTDESVKKKICKVSAVSKALASSTPIRPDFDDAKLLKTLADDREDSSDCFIVDDNVNVQESIVTPECNWEAEKEEALQTDIQDRSQRNNSINAKGLQRPKRTKNKPPFKVPSIRLAEKRTQTMSKQDYNFTQSSDSVPIGGKQMPGRTYHTNAIDTNYGADSAYRQQLQEMATSMGSLCNIGNSCYMNSVIYTLRYTPLFLHNLHHLVSDFAHIFNQKENQQKLKSASLGRTVNGLQGPNARSYSSKDLVSLGSSSSSTVSLPTLDIVKTTQQKATEKLHELFQCLSNNENAETTEPYQSDIFLKAIQDVNPIFEGNQQQDAHEFLMCILDSIRETCQSLKKNVIEHPEIIMQG